jgi:predicted MPP superfamily phosphohydrolase
VTGRETAKIIRQFHRRIRSDETGAKLARSHVGPWLQLFTPAGFEWTSVEIPIPGLPAPLEGLRVVHISDLHIRERWDRAYDQLIAWMRSKSPDLILISGDFIEDRHHHTPALEHMDRLVANLTSRHGVYGILGNHDNKVVGRHLTRLNVKLLDNRRHVVRIGDGQVELIGAARAIFKAFAKEWKRPAAPRMPDTVRIFVAHYPDTLAAAQRWEPHVFVCGHTHGGQVCLPNGFMFVRNSQLPQRFCRGVHRADSTWMVVNRGLGFSGPPVRLFCPAEVVELIFRAAP